MPLRHVLSAAHAIATAGFCVALAIAVVGVYQETNEAAAMALAELGAALILACLVIGRSVERRPR